MPDLYQRGDYDLAGFCVGVVERKRLIDGKQIAPDDVVLGVASSGLHSNGYSLVRKIVFDIAGLKIDDHVEELGRTVGEALMEPTRIYVRAVAKNSRPITASRTSSTASRTSPAAGCTRTSNGSCPKACEAIIRRDSWPVPPVFTWLQRLGEVEQSEMDQVFNMGIGLVLVVSPYYAESIQSQLADCGLESWTIGRVISGPRGVVWEE